MLHRISKMTLTKMRGNTEKQTVRDLIDHLQEAYTEVDKLNNALHEICKEAVKIVGDDFDKSYVEGMMQFISNAKERAGKIVKLCMKEKG